MQVITEGKLIHPPGKCKGYTGARKKRKKTELPIGWGKKVENEGPRV